MWLEQPIPREGLIDYRVFYTATNSSGSVIPQVYTRPAGATMVYIVKIDGGCGGGGGRSRAAGSDGGGGGGGSSGSIMRTLVPWILLPDTFFIHVGNGGAGGAANASGTGGTRGWVTAVPVTAAGSVSATQEIVGINGSVPGAGGAGQTTSGGSAGGGGSAPGTSWDFGGGLGLPLSLVGVAGSAGGAHTGAVGSSQTWGASGSILSGGAGGGGSTGDGDFAGGNITGSGLIPTIFGGQNAGDAGSAGYCDLSRMLFTGGAGGASNDAGTGGAGGAGGFGCGGGGGGAGVTGGAGGRGGDGLVIIACW